MSYVVKSVVSNQFKVKVVNQNGSLLQAPATVPVVVTSAVSEISEYSNTALMLANDATTYANAVTYANQVATAAYTNAIAYAANAAANVAVANLTDVVLSANPPANNSTLVYNSANNKYVVRQMDLDGGNF
jgi:hypothetical protein